jgi:hypothetical protein
LQYAKKGMVLAVIHGMKISRRKLLITLKPP